jgi:dTMP kinase
MALLFAADRLDHLEAEILPNLMDGVSVVSDRYDLSSLAYQSATSEEEGADAVDWIRALNRHARRPDLTIVVDVSAETAARRRRARGGTAELYEVTELQERLVAAYKNAEALVPGDRVAHVDGEMSVDDVEAAIHAAVVALRGG